MRWPYCNTTDSVLLGMQAAHSWVFLVSDWHGKMSMAMSGIRKGVSSECDSGDIKECVLQ